MPKSFIIKTTHLLSAINKWGIRVYYAIDHHSGGYPFWSDWVSSAQEFDVLEKIPVIGPNDYMRNNITTIEVLHVDLQVTVLDSVELVSVAKAKAMAEIEEIQRELAKKIESLKDMK